MVSHRKFMTKCSNKSIISYWSVPIVIIPEPQYTPIMIVLRVICSFCGKTHAILPDTIVPYSLVTLADTIGIILAESPQEVDRMLASNICLDLSDVYRIKTKFKMFWIERLSSFEINIDHSISRNCIRMFARQFMQIRCTLCGDYG